MFVKSDFKHAVCGVGTDHPMQSLIQIHRPYVNLATAFMPPSKGTQDYLRALDIENRYLKTKSAGYGYEPAYFHFQSGQLETIVNELHDGSGYDDLLQDLRERAAMFSMATGYDSIQVMLRVMSATKDNLVVHIDNQTDMRGLQTLMGNSNTLWLPDDRVKYENFHCTYDENGAMESNFLKTDDKDLRNLRQIDKHHMSIHKGGLHQNPLFHTAPGFRPDLNMYPGPRVIATFDRAPS